MDPKNAKFLGLKIWNLCLSDYSSCVHMFKLSFSLLGCRTDTMPIKMYKAPKVSAEGHNHTPQYPRPGWRPFPCQNHCLLYNPVLLKSQTV